MLAACAACRAAAEREQGVRHPHAPRGPAQTRQCSSAPPLHTFGRKKHTASGAAQRGLPAGQPSAPCAGGLRPKVHAHDQRPARHAVPRARAGRRLRGAGGRIRGARGPRAQPGRAQPRAADRRGGGRRAAARAPAHARRAAGRVCGRAPGALQAADFNITCPARARRALFWQQPERRACLHVCLCVWHVPDERRRPGMRPLAVALLPAAAVLPRPACHAACRRLAACCAVLAAPADGLPAAQARPRRAAPRPRRARAPRPATPHSPAGPRTASRPCERARLRPALPQRYPPGCTSPAH